MKALQPESEPNLVRLRLSEFYCSISLYPPKLEPEAIDDLNSEIVTNHLTGCEIFPFHSTVQDLAQIPKDLSRNEDWLSLKHNINRPFSKRVIWLWVSEPFGPKVREMFPEEFFGSNRV